MREEEEEEWISSACSGADCPIDETSGPVIPVHKFTN